MATLHINLISLNVPSHMSIHRSIHSYIHMSIHMSYTCLCTFISTHVHTCLDTSMHTCLCTCISTCLYTHVFPHVHHMSITRSIRQVLEDEALRKPGNQAGVGLSPIQNGVSAHMHMQLYTYIQCLHTCLKTYVFGHVRRHVAIYLRLRAAM